MAGLEYEFDNTKNRHGDNPVSHISRNRDGSMNESTSMGRPNSYEEMQGEEKRAHEGSQSVSPSKEDY